MQNSAVINSLKHAKIGQPLTIVACWVLFSSFFNGNNDDILLTVNDREITKSEFLYSYNKNYSDSVYHNINNYFKYFTDFHLKLAQARQEQLDRNTQFINEITNFRMRLAAPYLTDKQLEEALAREAYSRMLVEVNASHILVKTGTGDTLLAYIKAIQLRNKILGGEPFSGVARNFSDDPNAKINSGNLGYFTAFETDYTFETAVFNMNPGDLSMPVRSGLGYHIILCHDKRKNQEFKENIPSFEDIKDQLLRWVKREGSPRYGIIRETFAKRLKKDWNFTENPTAIQSLFSDTSLRILDREIKYPENTDPFQVLCTIDGKNLAVGDFFRYIAEQDTNPGNKPLKVDLPLFYKHFVTDRLITYENYKLEDKYPEFRYQLWEYRDAMLLLKIMEKEVWQKSASDSSGLALFYKKNIKKYRHNPQTSRKGQTIKGLSGIPDVVLSDYQTYLMQLWIERLRKEFKPHVNREVFSEIKKSLQSEGKIQTGKK